MTCAELTAVGLPAAFVPLPIGNGEQRLNAEPIVAGGGGLLVDDADLTPEWIRDVLLPVLLDIDRVANMSEAAAALGRKDADRAWPRRSSTWSACPASRVRPTSTRPPVTSPPSTSARTGSAPARTGQPETGQFRIGQFRIVPRGQPARSRRRARGGRRPPGRPAADAARPADAARRADARQAAGGRPARARVPPAPGVRRSPGAQGTPRFQPALGRPAHAGRPAAGRGSAPGRSPAAAGQPAHARRLRRGGERRAVVRAPVPPAGRSLGEYRPGGPAAHRTGPAPTARCRARRHPAVSTRPRRTPVRARTGRPGPRPNRSPRRAGPRSAGASPGTAGTVAQRVRLCPLLTWPDFVPTPSWPVP